MFETTTDYPIVAGWARQTASERHLHRHRDPFAHGFSARMRTSRSIHIVSCHAEAKWRLIVGGVAPPPADTLWEQSRFIARNLVPAILC